MRLRLFLVTILFSHSLSLAEDKKFAFRYAVDNAPAPDKVEKGGEDAFYANELVLTVADGVGGWAQHGIDPSLYSRRLAANIEQFFKESPEAFIANPKDLLIKAAQNNKEMGTSTLVVAILDPSSGVLRTSYVGDSSYIIIRKNYDSGKFEIVYRSKEQQHKFNFPFQIGAYGDAPTTAKTFTHELKYDDIVIVATDGIFDNLFNSRILKIVEEHKGESVREIADSLANTAFKLSINEKYKSPFAVGARKAGFYYLGGKSDDITVVVGKVVRPEEGGVEEHSDSLTSSH
jgi:protein phosphatase PTC7